MADARADDNFFGSESAQRTDDGVDPSEIDHLALAEALFIERYAQSGR